MLPLNGIRVVEVASFLAAPSAAALMADLGADVIKVEPPRGDTFRGNAAHMHEGLPINYRFEVDNRGKRSIALNLANSSGKQVLKKLVTSADIFVTNLTAGRTEKYGLDFESLKIIQPKLIYGHLVGYSCTGIDAERPGFDATAFWGRSGVMGLMGDKGTPAIQSRSGQGDHPTGLNLLAALLAALRLRDITGEAQRVEVSLQRTGLWTIATDMQQALNLPEHQPFRFDRSNPIQPMRGTYETADKRWLMLTMHNVPKYWPRLSKALNRQDWEADSRFTTIASLLKNGSSIVAEIEEIFLSQDLSYWAKKLDDNECIWAPAASLDEVAADPVLRDQGAFQTLLDSEGSPYEVVSTPFMIDGVDIRSRKRAPLVGENNFDVLQELGFSESEIADLAEQGIFTEGESHGS